MMPHLNEQERAIAIGRLQAGIPLKRVARQMNVTPKALRELRDKFMTTGLVRDRPRTGRPRVTTPAQDQQILDLTLQNRFATGKKAWLLQVSTVNPNGLLSKLYNSLKRTSTSPYTSPVVESVKDKAQFIAKIKRTLPTTVDPPASVTSLYFDIRFHFSTRNQRPGQRCSSTWRKASNWAKCQRPPSSCRIACVSSAEKTQIDSASNGCKASMGKTTRQVGSTTVG